MGDRPLRSPSLSPPVHELPPSESEFDRLLLELMLKQAVPVAEGVLAHVRDNGVWLEVRGVLAAEPRVPGAVGAWLDTLPTERKVVVPAVVSERLVGMLQRRGFTLERWWDNRIRRWDDGAMIRRPM